jgi:hypothetical protein
MKISSYLLAAGILTATVFLVGCNKKKTDATTNPNPPIATVTINPANKGNSGTAIAELAVTASTLNATLRLNVTSDVYITKIYVMGSPDNGPLMPVSLASITDSAGLIFGGNAQTYSLLVPANTSTFSVDIPVNVRTTTPATSDVYYIWFTNGNGDFLKPTKNTVLGPSIITLNYTTASVNPYDSAAIIPMGDQTAITGNLLVTSGKISSLNTISYIDAPASADLSLTALDATGTTKTDNSGILWFISPSLRSGLGYPGCPACGTDGNPVAEPTTANGANVTYIAPYQGSFEAATGLTLAALSVGTATQAQITAVGNVFMFYTAKGKQGLVKVTALSAVNGSPGAVTVSVKVLN